MRWTKQDIKNAFGGKLVGDDYIKNIVTSTLLKFPDQIIEYITKNCWILSSSPDAWAYTFRGNDLKDKHLIFLSDELLSETVSQIQYTLAHEIGHIILKHRNSINYRQSKHEIGNQEYEADQFAKKYLVYN